MPARGKCISASLRPHRLALLLWRGHAPAREAPGGDDVRGGDRRHLGVHSLRFISLDGLYRAVGEAGGRDPASPRYCDACFSGDYPVEPADMIEAGFRLKAVGQG